MSAPLPPRYLSTTVDPRATRCSMCDGIGTVRRGPGDYATCDAPGCKGGRVNPPTDAPRLWRVIGHSGSPECRDTDDIDAALVTWDRADTKPPTKRDAIPVWDGDAGRFVTLGTMGIVR